MCAQTENRFRIASGKMQRNPMNVIKMKALSGEFRIAIDFASHDLDALRGFHF